MLNFLLKVKAYPVHMSVTSPDEFFDHFFREVGRLEKRKSKEYEAARAAASVALHDVEVAGVRDDPEISDNDDVEADEAAMRRFAHDAGEDLISEDDGFFGDVEYD